MEKLSDQDIKELIWGGDVDGFEVVEETRWDSSHKFETKKVYIMDLETKKFYCLPVYRSGSHFTEFNYDFPTVDDIYEVEKVQISTYEWRAK